MALDRARRRYRRRPRRLRPTRGGTLTRHAAQRATIVQPLRRARHSHRGRVTLLTRPGWCVSIARPMKSSPGWPRRGPHLTDGLVYTLTLREGIAWSDGTPFTSADVRFSFEAAFDPRAKSVLASALTVDGKPLDRRGARRAHGGRHASRAVRPRHPPARQSRRSCRSTSSTAALEDGTFAAGVGADDAAQRDGRARAVRARALRAGPAADLRAQSRTTGVATTPACSCPYLDRRGRSRSCRTRTPKCCACSRATST